MVTYAILFVVLIVGTTIVLSWPLGRYMKWAMDPEAPDAGTAGAFTKAFKRIGGRSHSERGRTGSATSSPC